MDLAASLPRAAERIDMRFQWLWRVLMNPLIDPDAVMAPFARKVMELPSGAGEPLVLVLDQSKINARHHLLMLALRFGERALPPMWRVEATDVARGSDRRGHRLCRADAAASGGPAHSWPRARGFA